MTKKEQVWISNTQIHQKQRHRLSAEEQEEHGIQKWCLPEPADKPFLGFVAVHRNIVYDMVALFENSSASMGITLMEVGARKRLELLMGQL